MTAQKPTDDEEASPPAELRWEVATAFERRLALLVGQTLVLLAALKLLPPGALAALLLALVVAELRGTGSGWPMLLRAAAIFAGGIAFVALLPLTGPLALWWLRRSDERPVGFGAMLAAILVSLLLWAIAVAIIAGALEGGAPPATAMPADAGMVIPRFIFTILWSWLWISLIAVAFIEAADYVHRGLRPVIPVGLALGLLFGLSGWINGGIGYGLDPIAAMLGAVAAIPFLQRYERTASPAPPEPPAPRDPSEPEPSWLRRPEQQRQLLRDE